MKRITLLTIALLALTTLSAQPGVPNEVIYYGVDFSAVKIYGASRSGERFVRAFGEINDLVIADWDDYKFERRLRKRIVDSDISVTRAVNDLIDPESLGTESTENPLSDDQIAAMVRRYEIDETEGTGLVLIGEILNEWTNPLIINNSVSIINDDRGTFTLVYFDIATRRVLFHKSATGTAELSFRLPNYWAWSIRHMLRKVKPYEQ